MQGFRGGSEATDKQALPQGRKCRENNTPQALAASSRAHTSLEEKPWSPHFTGRENWAIKDWYRASLVGSVVKNAPANSGDTGSLPGPGRSHRPWNKRRACALAAGTRTSGACAPWSPSSEMRSPRREQPEPRDRGAAPAHSDHRGASQRLARSTARTSSRENKELMSWKRRALDFNPAGGFWISWTDRQPSLRWHRKVNLNFNILYIITMSSNRYCWCFR